MMITLKKLDSVLLPENQESADYIHKMKYGTIISANFTKPRNYSFHKKYFALIKFAYENWQPTELEDSRWEGVVPEKSFDRFRKDLVILSGHFEAVYRIDGSVRVEAKSISFAKMTEESFSELYNSTTTVVLEKILTNYTREDLDTVLEKLERFY